MSVYTQTLLSGLTITIPTEVNSGDIFIGNVLIILAILGLALIAIEVFA